MHKKDIQLWMAVFTIVVGCVLLITGFIVKPTGIIDSSVLIAFGEAATFCGSLLGIHYKYRKTE